MSRWVNRIREPAGAIPASARKLLVWGGGGALILAVGWSTWKQEAAAPPLPPNPAEAQPPPAPEVMNQADTFVKASLRELDEQERLRALQEADRRLQDQKRRRALQQAVGDHMRDPTGTLTPSQMLPVGEYEELDVVAEEIRQQEARRRYESLRAPQIVAAAEGREPQTRSAPPVESPEGDPSRERPSAAERVYEGLARALENPERYGSLLQEGTAGIPAEESERPQGRAGPGEDAPPMVREPADPEGWERLYEGEFLECVLVTQLRGDFPGPANAMVAVDMWSRDRQRIVVPRGSRVLGTASAVSQWGQARLGVAFHRLIFPDGRYVSLDQFRGLNQVGETGLKDKVNNHYRSVFGAAAAVGLLSGLTAQDTSVYGPAGDRIRAGAGANLAQQGLAITERFLNRLPTVTIRAGHRVRVYFTSDLLVPRAKTER